jgi:hypothetical protein
MPLSRDAALVKSRAARLSALVVLAVVANMAVAATAERDAQADEKETCVRAVEHAQVVRLDGKLREARAGFMTCARPVCPDAIREDCIRWVTEVDASLPSVVVDAIWADGRDVAGLTVLLDGQPLAGAAAGRAVTLDPGAHVFRFEVPGAAPVETRYVIKEGEKNRILHVTFAPSAAGTPAVAPAPVFSPAPAAAPVSSPASAPTPGSASASASPAPAPSVSPAMWQLTPDAEPVTRRPIPISAFVVGGFALVGFGAFAYLGLSGTSQLDSLRATCVHSCSSSDVSSARNEILAGDIVGFVALAATGVATWLVVTRATVPASAQSR